MRRVFPALAGGLICLVAPVVGAGQAEQTAFRAGVELIDVGVSVLDRNRLPVRGPAADDFTILEDGRPRPVVAFAAVDLPARRLLDARWMVDVAPDVVDNDLQREGRLVTILIDQSVLPEALPAAVRTAEAVVERLRPGDLAAVVYSTFGVPRNFTADRARLLHAIRQPLVGLPVEDSAGPSLCRCGACSLETIGNVAEALAPVRQRRKLLVLISSDIAMHTAGQCSGDLDPARERALRAIDVANVTVYTFDPRGEPGCRLPYGVAGGGPDTRTLRAFARGTSWHLDCAPGSSVQYSVRRA
jgi:VWFA-related protein